MKHPLIFIICVIAAVLILFIIVQVLFIRFSGSPVAIPEIPRDIQTDGTGDPIAYAVMGDSTAISQGSEYEQGFAYAGMKHLSATHTVRAINTGISGATTQDVRNDQLQAAVQFRPDIVLLAAGANDSTHFTSDAVIRDSVQHIIDELKKVNPTVRIIVTASPAMDSVTRFPNGSKQLIGLRSRHVNEIFRQLIEKNNLILAPIAEKTRDAFIADPTLTASDNFHPNARGYALWIPVVNDALDEAVASLNGMN